MKTRKLNVKRALIVVLVVLVLLLIGCQTAPTQPVCSLPPVPSLPTIDWAELQGSDDALYRLELYEARLVDSWLEHRVIVETVCGEDG